MRLTENSFYLLGASTRDDRRRLVQLADEHALTHDHAAAAQARGELANPRLRIKAELAWLPGIAPKRAQELAELASSGNATEDIVVGLPAPAAVNVRLWLLRNLSDGTCHPSLVAGAVFGIAKLVEDINWNDVLRRINEDRVIAGFPSVESVESLDTEINEWHDQVARAVVEVMRRLPKRERLQALHDLVVRATDDGNTHGPPMVHDVADMLGVDFEDELNTLSGLVASEIKVLRRMLASGLPEDDLLRQSAWLDQALRTWDAVAQPLQVSAQGRGREHDHSQKLAREVRKLAVDVHNDRAYTSVSQRIIAIMASVFSELGKISAQTEEDLRLFDAWLQARRERSKQYLSISPDGVCDNKVVIPLDQVTRIRWGGTRQSINGTLTGTIYKIVVGSENATFEVELREDGLYQSLVGALNSALLFRLVVDLAQRLGKGAAVPFGSVAVRDRGVHLAKSWWFGADLRRFWKWSELETFSSDGHFRIQATADRSYSAALSYQESDNVHVLEALIKAFWKRGAGTCLSEVFSDHA